MVGAGSRCQTRSMADIADVIRTEREALIELLETLTPEQWAVQSLCDQWNVQALGAHLAWASTMPPHRMVVDLARAGGRVNKMIADEALRDRSRGVPAILDQLRDNAATGAKPMGMPKEAVVGDAVVHQLDARVPLRKPRKIPRDAFVIAADFFAKIGFPGSVVVGGNVRKRVAGLRLVADDVDWTHGDGPEVHGSSEALMLMLAGRPVPSDALTGPGATELYARL